MNYQNFRQPKTYFVGQTVLCPVGMEQYLRDTGQEAFLQDMNEAAESGLSAGEILCSFYAKACYAALTTEKNKNISRVRDIRGNIAGTIASGHGCYDDQTEVLTLAGWKNWKSVSKDDFFATLTPDGLLSWEKARRIYSADYDGEMVRYDSNQVDLLVTPNHRMFTCLTTTKEGRTKEFTSFEFHEAGALISKSHAFMKAIPETVESIDPIPEFQLLGFAIGDGSLKGSSKLEFNLRRKRKIRYLRELLSALNLDHQEKDGKFRINLSSKISPLFSQIYNQEKEKVIPREIFLEYPFEKEVHYSVFDGIMNSDGSIGETSDCYDTTSEVLAGQFQALCMMLGKGSNISQASCYKNRESSFGDKPIFRCSIVTRNNKPEFNKSSGDQYPKSKIENYSGKIFCAEVPHNTLFVRRNGKSVWCGNSVFEHCQLNFMVADCSRVFTHELVRHRVGTAFSQTSGRYVRSDILNVVIDPILEPVYEEIEEARTFLEEWYERIEKKLDLDNETDFDRKKKLTSAMRRMLPNGQANEIGFSVNLRSLRHTIRMRTSRHAEWEIRLVFNQIYDLLQSKYPGIFADAILEEVEGIMEISFENEKI